MNTKNAIPLTPFQKDLISQVLHDEISAMTEENIVEVTDIVDEIVNKIEKSLLLAVGLKQARENDFWSKVEVIKQKVTLSIKKI